MKRFTALTLSLVMMASLFSGCSGTNETDKETTPTTISEEGAITDDAERETIEFGTPFQFTSTEYKLDDVDLCIAVDKHTGKGATYDGNNANYDYVSPMGKTCVALTYTVTNNDRVSVDVRPYSNFVSDCIVVIDGVEYELEWLDGDSLFYRYIEKGNTELYRHRGQPSAVKLNSGEEMTFITYFLVSTDVEDFNCHYEVIYKDNVYEIN